MKVLSLFDGMSCGMIAMLSAGVQIERYVAYEIDKYAVKTSLHNFPNVEQCGDVFAADFTKYRGFDFMIGGSPCTYWSIAQKNNRETEASGLGWELFSQFVRALYEVQPKYFIYENNKSMSTEIRDSIRETFGFEEICINSALVSGQNRLRYYWVGKRNADGTYSKVDVRQPEDLGILLKDILDCSGSKELTESEMMYMVRETTGSRNHFDFGYIQDGNKEKSKCLTANISKGVPYNVCCDPVRIGTYPRNNGTISESKQYRIYSHEGNATTQCAEGDGIGAKTGLYAIPCCVAERGRYNESGIVEQHMEAREDGKTNTVTTVQKDNNVAVPVSCRRRGRMERKTGESYAKYECRCDGKANTIDTNTVNGSMVAEHIPQYATPTEWDENGIPTKAVSGADGKVYTVYQVLNGNITIKGKTYPIKLVDGFYIIRKLTVTECMRLQTVPEWYDFSCVSNTQAYKMLGNGWTCRVITHLINACLSDMVSSFLE